MSVGFPGIGNGGLGGGGGSVPFTVTTNSITFAGGSSLTDNGSGQITIAAAGTNQNVVLTPSGTGSVVLGGGSVGASGSLLSMHFATNNNLGFYVKNGHAALGGLNDAASGYSILQIDGSGVYLNGNNTSANVVIGSLTDNSNGKLQLASSTSSTAGIAFGNDSTQASIYRSAASTLTSPASWVLGGSITTGAPNSGTAGAWKMGILVTITSVFDTTRYIQLDVGGTLYKVALCQ